MEQTIYLPELKPRTIDALRDMAIKLESNDLETAKELMQMAHLARPNGPFIKNKLEEYKQKEVIPPSASKLKLDELLASGELVIIPAGFRCHTKASLKETIGLDQESFPLDVGFYSPAALVSLLKNPQVDLTNNEQETNHSVCLKYENYNDPVHGLGIKFVKSTYAEIDALTESRDAPCMHQYLDSTFGYFTLDHQHQFVLAHYNWHKFANPAKSKGVCDPKVNIATINDTLNRRLKRMFEVCHQAKYILFVYEETQGYNYLMIDDQYYDINDYSEVKSTLSEIFKAKSFVSDLSEVKTPEKIIELIS